MTSFLCFNLSSKKIGRLLSSDNRRPILFHQGVLSKVDARKLITRWVINCDIRMFVVSKFTALSKLHCTVPVFKTASSAATATKPRPIVRDRGRIGGLMDIIAYFGEFLTRPLPLRNENQRRFQHVFVILVLY